MYANVSFRSLEDVPKISVEKTKPKQIPITLQKSTELQNQKQNIDIQKPTIDIQKSQSFSISKPKNLLLPEIKKFTSGHLSVV